MRKINLSLIATAVLMTTACNFEIPEKISVKTNAEYNFSVGSFEKDLSDKINIKSLVNDSTLSSVNGKVYDYFPTGTDDSVQRFLLKVPFMEIPVDMGKYYDDSMLSEAIKDVSFEKEFAIPTVQFSETISLGSMSEINDAINGAATINSTFSGTTSDTASFPGCTGGLDFTTIKYSSCVFSIQTTGIPDNTTITIASGGKSVSGKIVSDKVNISATDFTIEKAGTTVSFSTAVTGGLVCRISNGVISQVTGFSLSSAIPSLPEVHKTISIPNNFESLTVGSGYFKTTVSPAGWDSVISNSIKTSGGITIAETTAKTVDLSTKTITAGDVNIDAKPSLTFSNATINFSTNPVIKVEFVVSSISEIIFDASTITTTVNKSETLPSSVITAVKSIKLAPSGIKGSYTNTLPAGNDIGIKVNSNFFDFTNKTTSLTAGGSGTFTPILCDNNLSRTFGNTAPAFNSWDINLQITLPGSTTGKFKLVNVVPGSTYKLGMTVTPVLDWNEIILDQDAVGGVSFNGKQSLGINIGDLLGQAETASGITGLKTKLNFSSLPVYIHAEKPDMTAFNQFVFKGKISLYQSAAGNPASVVSDASGEIKQYLLGSAASTGDITFVDAMPPLNIVNKVLKTNVAQQPYSLTADLAALFNRSKNSTGELCMEYDVALTTDTGDLTLTKADLTDNSAYKISAYAFIELPVEFITEASGLDVDLLNLIGSTEIPTSSVDSMKKYIDTIESASVVYSCAKLPLHSVNDIKATIKLFSDEPAKTVNARSDTLTLTSHEINRILNDNSSYTINGLNVTVPGNTKISFPRNMDFKANIDLKFVTNGTVDILGGNN